jgi:hypothetical protein
MQVQAHVLHIAACRFSHSHDINRTHVVNKPFGDLHDKSLSRGETEVPHAPRQGAPGFLDGRYEPSRRSRSEALLSVAEA